MGLFGKKEKKTNHSCCGNVEGLIVKDNLEVKEQESGCGCEGDGGCDGKDTGECNQEATAAEDKELVIKVLGSGCKNCITLAENVNKALEEMKLEARIEKVTDFGEITRYGVMSTPALVVKEKVVSYGKVLKPQEIITILEKILA